MQKRRINPADIQFEIDHQDNRTLVRASVHVSLMAEISKEVDFSQVEETTRQNLTRALMDLIYGDMWILAREIGINIFEFAPELTPGVNEGVFRAILDKINEIDKIGKRDPTEAIHPA